MQRRRGFFGATVLVAILFASSFFIVSPVKAAVTPVQHVNVSGTVTTPVAANTLSTSITPTTTGDLLVAAISLKNAPASTPPTISGWVLKTSQCASTNTACTYVFTKLAGTNGVADTVTTSNLNPTSGVYSGIMTVFEYSGATNTSISFTSNSGTTGQPNAGPVTPAVSNTLIFGIAAQETGTAYSGTTTGTVGTWTKEFSDKNTGAAGVYNLNIGYFDILSGTSGTGYTLYPSSTSTSVPWSVIVFNFDSQVSQTSAPTLTSPIGSGATSVSGTSSELNGTVIQVYADGVATGTTTTVSGGVWTKTGLTALTAGQVITAKATASGKSTSVASNSVTVSAAPTLSSVSISSNSATSTLAKVGNTVTLSFTASEAISSPTVAFTSGSVAVTNSVTVTNTSGNNWTATYVTSSSDTDGAVAYSISSYHSTANNSNGATVTSGSGSVTFDKTAPAAPGTPDMTTGSDSGSSSTDNITSTTAPAFTISCETGATVSLKESTTVLGTGTCSGSTVTITSSTLSEAVHTVKALQTDAAGNVSADSSTLSVTIDATAPSAPGTPDLTAGTDTGASSSDNITLNTTPAFTISCESGVTVSLKESTTVLGTGTCASSTVTITSSTLSAGSHTVKALQTDPAGNISADSSTLSITIDVTAPTATGTPDLTSGTDSGSSSTDNITSVTTPAFSLSCETGAVVSLKEGSTVLGTGTCSGSTVTITSSTLSEASHTVKAFQTDPAGNASIDSASLSIIVDATAPSIPGTPDLTAGTDTGASSTDNVTSTTTPAFTISCETGTTVTLKENSDVLGTGTCSGGTVTITSTTLSETSHTVKALQTDASGNVSADSSTLLITIDGTAPAAPGIPDLTSGTDNGSSSTDNVTSNTMPAFSMSCETGTTVTLKEGSNVLGTGTCSGSTVTITSSTLSDASHDVYVLQTDSAGNVSETSSTLSVTIDSTAPSAPDLPDMTTESDTGSSSTDSITLDTTPSFAIDCETGSSVSLKEGSTVLAAGTCVDGTVTLTSSELSQGSHTLKAMQTDAAGNMSDESSTLSVTIDTGSPLAPGAPDLTSGSDSGSSSSDNITSDATPSFSMSCESGATVSLKEGLVVVGTGTCAVGSATVVADELTEGSHAIKAFQTDVAGNDSTDSSALSITVDITAPEAPTITSIGGSDNAINIAEKGAVHVVGTAEAGSVMAVSLADVGSAHTSSGSGTATGGNYDITLNAISLNDGLATPAVTATDVAGNVSAATTIPAAIKDTVRPTAAMTYSSSHIKSGDSITITGTFSEAMAEAPLIRIAISGAETVGPVEMTRVSATVYTYTHTLGPDAGTATVSLSDGTDLASNTVSSTPVSGASFTIDNRSPIPTVQAPIFAGSSNVTGTTAGPDNATVIEVFVRRGLATTSLGTTTTVVDGVWTLSGLGATALRTDDVVTAKAEIDNDRSGVLGDAGDAYSAASSPVTVTPAVSPVPSIDIGIFPGTTTITGTGLYTSVGTRIDIYCARGGGNCVNSDPIATATVGIGGTWTSTSITLGTLQVGDVFTAEATIDTDGSGAVNGADTASADSSAVIVINPTSPVPSIDQLIAQTDSVITGVSTGPEGTVIEVFVNGGSCGTTAVQSDGTWTFSLEDCVVTDGDTVTAQATIDTNGDGVVITNSLNPAHDAPSSLSSAVLSGAEAPVTNAPVLDEPVVAGATTISGLSSETGNTVFRVYLCDRSGACFDGDDVLLGTTAPVLTTGPWTAWSLSVNGSTFTSATLRTGDIIYATAQTGTEVVSAASSQLTLISKISPTPSVTAPEAGASSITGTVSAPAGTIVSVSVRRGTDPVFTETATVVGSSGVWTLVTNGTTFTTATLQTGDIVQARAEIDNNNDGTVGNDGDTFSSLSSLATVFSRSSPIPDILGPITAGDSSISGTSTGPDNTVVEVFDATTPLGTVLVTDGAWTLDELGISTLSVDDVITARARIDTNNDGENTTDDTYSALSPTLTVRAVPTKDISSFSFPEGDGVISGTDIDVTVPYGTDVTALIPTVSHNGASISPASGLANDFSTPQTYTVRASDASMKDYIVTVNIALNPAKAFSAFTILDDGTITEEDHTIAVTVPYGTVVTALTPAFSVTGSSVTVGGVMQSSGGTTQDFSSPVTYVVHAADGTTEEYVVTVTIARNPAKEITDFSFLTPSATGVIDEDAHTVALTVPYGTPLSTLVATFSITGDHVMVDESLQTSGVSANNYSSSVTFIVYAADGSHQDYLVTVTSARDPAKVLSTFTILGNGSVTESGHTVAVAVPYGTDLTSLAATFTTTGTSLSVGDTPQVSGVTTNDFTNPLFVTVHAADGTTQNYVVTVMVVLRSTKTITSFTTSTSTDTAISEEDHTIQVTVPHGTNIAHLVPTITVSGASVSPASGEVQNFIFPQTYTVTAEDGTTQDYLVTVTVSLDSAKAITSFTILGNGVVDDTHHTIAVSVPAGTDVTALVPSIVTTGASVSPAADEAEDFTHPVVYTVIAADGSRRTYVVTVTVAAAEDVPAPTEHGGSGNHRPPAASRPTPSSVSHHPGVANPVASYNAYRGHWDAPASQAVGASPYQTVMEPISSVANGWYIRGEHYDTVYYVSPDMKRHPFWDAQTYFTWANSWDQVIWVTDATLPTLPLASPMLPHESIVLVKIQSNPNVYAVGGSDNAPELHLIPNETTATAIFGAHWADYVIDMPPTVFPNFNVGVPLTLSNAYDTSFMRKRIELRPGS